MYEKLESCPICNSAQSSNHLIVTDHSISKEDFALMQCSNCSLIYTSPRPDQDNIWKYYQDDNYISHSNKANSLRDIAYRIVRHYTLNQKHKLISSYTQQKTILDYGAGTGHFLNYLNKKGYSITGIEPSDIARQNIAKAISSNIYSSQDLLPKEKTFNIITAWHVIEHVHQLLPTLKTLKKKLKEGGYLFLALPNYKSWDAIHYKEFWAGYDVPRHLYHFSQESVHTLANKLKLSIVDTHPMKFDSFYVSMLSEQYQAHTSSFINGIKQGLKSNRSAKQTGEYSSLIYVLRK